MAAFVNTYRPPPLPPGLIISESLLSPGSPADNERALTLIHPVTRSSMARTVVFTDKAPRAIGPYSQAVRAGNTVYLSGQIALDPKTGELVSGDFEQEARRVFENLKAVAEAAGSGLKDVARVTIYLTDLAHIPKVNKVRAE